MQKKKFFSALSLVLAGITQTINAQKMDTQFIAINYSYRNSNQYKGIEWINISNAKSNSDILKLAKRSLETRFLVENVWLENKSGDMSESYSPITSYPKACDVQYNPLLWAEIQKKFPGYTPADWQNRTMLDAHVDTFIEQTLKKNNFSGQKIKAFVREKPNTVN